MTSDEEQISAGAGVQVIAEAATTSVEDVGVIPEAPGTQEPTPESMALAAAQAEEDHAFIVENPQTPLIRAADPELGGEAFGLN